MKRMIPGICAILLLTAVYGGASAQTKCVWIEKSENGVVVQKLGVSLRLVKLLARPGSNFDVNGVSLSYDTLLTVYESGSKLRLEDSTGNGETIIDGGKFDQKMKEESKRHNHLIVESSDSGETPKVTKLRVESVEAVGVLLAMIGAGNLDKNLDMIESALERGGVLYIRDYRKNSRLWIYVN